MEGTRLEWRVDELEGDLKELKDSFAKIGTDVADAKKACETVGSDQKVVVERVTNMIDAYKAQRNALYSAAGALVMVAVGIVLRGLGIL